MSRSWCSMCTCATVFLVMTGCHKQEKIEVVERKHYFQLFMVNYDLTENRTFVSIAYCINDRSGKQVRLAKDESILVNALEGRLKSLPKDTSYEWEFVGIQDVFIRLLRGRDTLRSWIATYDLGPIALPARLPDEISMEDTFHCGSANGYYAYYGYGNEELFGKAGVTTTYNRRLRCRDGMFTPSQLAIFDPGTILFLQTSNRLLPLNETDSNTTGLKLISKTVHKEMLLK